MAKFILSIFEDTTATPPIGPDDYALLQSYPNPFKPQTQIVFVLPERGPVRLSVHDILGREVVVLVNKSLPSGVHNATWDGRDRSGQRVSAGIYFCYLRAGQFAASMRMLLVQ